MAVDDCWGLLEWDLGWEEGLSWVDLAWEAEVSVLYLLLLLDSEGLATSS